MFHHPSHSSISTISSTISPSNSGIRFPFIAPNLPQNGQHFPHQLLISTGAAVYSEMPKLPPTLLASIPPLASGSSRGAVQPCERCAVCCDQAQGVHFGVIVCRACAAFFRRSTIAKRVYKCRFDGNCPIDQREVRCSCRACRLAKCLALGMDSNAVQRHRDQIGPRKRGSMEKEEIAETINGEGEAEEEPMEMKPRLLTRSSTEETEPHIQVVDQHQHHYYHPNVGPTNLLPPLTLIGTLAQQKQQQRQPKEEILEEDAGESHSANNILLHRMSRQSTTAPNNSEQVLHFEDGKSYTLLGPSPLIMAAGNSAPSFPIQSLATTTSATFESATTNSSAAAVAPSISELLLLRALPSAFSPINHHPSLASAANGNHQQTDSGNVSANSSAFSSPLNLAAVAAAGQQFSPMNSIIGIASSSSSSSSGGHSSVPGLSNPPFLASSSATTSFANPQSAHSKPLMTDMLRGYRKFLSLRRTAKHLKGGECPFDELGQLKVETPTEGTYTNHVASIKADLSLLSEMLEDYFHPSRALQFSTHSKLSLLRNFFCTFIIAERCHLSTQHFPGQEDSRLFCSSNNYLDISNLDRFFAVEQCRTNPKEIAKVFQPVFAHFQSLIRWPMAKLRLSEFEFVGLLGLLYWNHRIDPLNVDEQKVVLQTREKIFEELYQVCRTTNGEEEAGIRFCSLVNMHHFLQKAAVEIASAYSLVNVVQKFQTDPFVLNQFLSSNSF